MSRRVYHHSEYYKTLADTDEWRFIKDVKNLILKAEYFMHKAKQKEPIILRNMAIGSMLYITAGRVSEMPSIKIKDLKIYENRLHFKYLSVYLINKKNRTQKFKKNIANFKNEKFFIDVIYKYYRYRVKLADPNINAKKLIYGMYENNDHINDILELPFFIETIHHKAYARDSIRKMTTRFYKMNSHTFRKIRLTHLVRHYNMSAKEIQNFAGHSSIESAEPYINITNKDFEAKMSFVAR